MTEREKLLRLEQAMATALEQVTGAAELLADFGCRPSGEILEAELGAVLVSTRWMLARMAQLAG